MSIKRGAEAIRALEEAEKLSAVLKEKAVARLWLKPGEEAHVIFVDDEPVWCERHVVKVGDKKFVEFTCLSPDEPCPICLKEGKRPLGITYYTVIDLRQYERRDGTLVKHNKVLLPARRTLAKQIIDFKNKFGSLVGLRAILKRYSQQDPSCGIIIDFVRDNKGVPKKYNLSALGKDYTIPFDYEKVLAPPTKEELKAFGFGLAIVGDTPTLDDEEDLEDLENETEVPEEELAEEEIVEEEPEVEAVENEEDEFEDLDLEEDFDDFDLEEEEEEKPKPKKKSKK